MILITKIIKFNKVTNKSVIIVYFKYQTIEPNDLATM
jgi:hypothetical protein